MRYNIIVHMASGEPIEGEIDELPSAQATHIVLKNPHRRGNRDLDWLDHRTNTVIIPFAHFVTMEVVLGRSEQEIITKTGVDLLS